MNEWMKSWRRRATVALAAAAIVLPAATLLAQTAGEQQKQARRQFRSMGGMRALEGLGFAARQLDLTDAQREQMRGIMQSHGEELRGLEERMRTAREKVNTAVQAETVDEAAIRSANSELAEVQADGAVLRAKVRQEMWAVLTPEQQEKAKSLQAEARQRLQERRQRLQDRVKQRRGAPAE